MNLMTDEKLINSCDSDDRVQTATDRILNLVNKLQGDITSWKEFSLGVESDFLKREISSGDDLRMNFVIELNDLLNILDPVGFNADKGNVATDYYATWTESELRNAIWKLSNGMCITGPYSDIELLRAELKLRCLSPEGYHNT